MTREQRTVMDCIINDMIKADNIIEESEIKDMKKLMSDYGITYLEMSEARKIRFSEAINTIEGVVLEGERMSS